LSADENRVYRITELTGTSTTGLDEAIQGGISRAAKTLRNLDWFEVTDIRGHIAEGSIAHYQVTMKVGFRLDE
jgi:flavin-binding protein dodecin